MTSKLPDMDCIDKRIDDYIGHAPEVDEDISTKAARRAYRAGAMEQIDIDAKEMKALNEEWEDNLKIQRAMLIDKACGFLEEFNGLNFLGLPTVDVEGFRKWMEDNA